MAENATEQPKEQEANANANSEPKEESKQVEVFEEDDDFEEFNDDGRLSELLRRDDTGTSNDSI